MAVQAICSIPGCGKPHKARSFCGAHVRRLYKHGDALGGCAPKWIDLAGQRFGLLVAVNYAGLGSNGSALWFCKCDCGVEKAILSSSLRRGASRSCGCGIAARRRQIQTTHGASDTRLFSIWHGMRQRCRNTNIRSYKWYGARGIDVCPEWDDFAAFRTWAFANGYAEDLTIDRTNNDLGYFPENCTWQSRDAQNANRAIVRKAPDGRPAWQVAEENGIPRRTYNSRIADGWSLHDAMTRPLHPYRGRSLSARST